MEDALKAGKCRAIGVSNFTVAHLQALKETATVWPPAVNQVELHPYHSQQDLRRYCESEGIVVQAYASLGGQDAGKGVLEKLGGSLLAHPQVLAIAEKYSPVGVSAAGVLLRWATQKGIAVLPKSSSPQRMAENFVAATGALGGCTSAVVNSSSSGAAEVASQAASEGSWELDESDMAALDALDQSSDESSRLCWARDPLKNLDFD
jgi:diketogulonate reductase-like aldo/keto reductase